MGLRIRPVSRDAAKTTVRLPDGRPAVVEYGPPPKAEAAPPKYRPATTAQLDAWYDALRSAMRKADKAKQKWEARQSWCKRYLEANSYSESDARKFMTNDWGLIDALDAWSFHEREAKRYQGMLQAEATMRSLYSGRL